MMLIFLPFILILPTLLPKHDTKLLIFSKFG